MEEYKSERIEKYLVFSRVCLIGRVKSRSDEKLFYLVEEKNGKIEYIIYINFHLCPYYIYMSEIIYLYSLNDTKINTSYK